MKVFVTGVAGQLGHDVMNELSKRGYEGIGSDIAPEYSGVQDGSAVTTMPFHDLAEIILELEIIWSKCSHSWESALFHQASCAGRLLSRNETGK